MSEKTETYFLNKCLKFSNKTDICIKSTDLSSSLPLFRPNFLEIFSFFKWQERRLFLKQFFILSMKLWFSSYKMVLIKSALKQVFLFLTDLLISIEKSKFLRCQLNGVCILKGGDSSIFCVLFNRFYYMCAYYVFHLYFVFI